MTTMADTVSADTVAVNNSLTAGQMIFLPILIFSHSGADSGRSFVGKRTVQQKVNGPNVESGWYLTKMLFVRFFGVVILKTIKIHHPCIYQTGKATLNKASQMRLFG